MKIYTKGPVGLVILVFLAFVLFPFYNNIGKVNAKPDPKTDTPAIQEWEKQYGKKECVESKEFMRTEHMQLLNSWRDAVVREGYRGYLSDTSHKRFNMSLQNECMHCHSNKKKFCDECHNYMAVKPYCWNCHIAPKEDDKS
ncbi:MAG TPA: sulfate reduction electron transfer complex DsrMKJOP subunit DsrJ [Nitrospirota bacterium]